MAPKDMADAYEGEPSKQQELLATSTAPKANDETTAACSRRDTAVAGKNATPKKTKKRLRWSTITIHEFGVGLGGSSVPGKGGPSIGLADKPEFTWTTKVGQMAECCEGIHRFSAEERVRLLQSAGVSDGMILRFSRETNIINGSRRRTLVEDIAEEKQAKKRKAETPLPMLERPCSPFLSRPRMISANYA